MESKNKQGFSFKKLMSKSGMGVLLAFIVLCIFLSITTKAFLTTANLMVVLRQSVWVGLLAIGMTFIISTGEIDLSVGSTVGFCGMIAAALLKNYNAPVILALLAAIAAGLLIGCINGILAAKVKIASFIATLAMMQIIRGLIYVYTGGVPIFGLKIPSFTWLAQGYIGFLPVPILLLAIITAIFWYVMYRTKFGRQVLSVGSNIEAAKLVGINVDSVKLKVYIITGFLASLSGILLAARSEAAIVEAGSGYETDAIAAVVIAGTSMAGGSANLLGCILGAVLMTTIRNGLNLLKVGSSWHQVVIGIVIILSLIFDKAVNAGKKG
ncbi:MAG: ABC transporter permease [Blautia sp.]|nr:ABC transporter permease [Blautia sp.]